MARGSNQKAEPRMRRLTIDNSGETAHESENDAAAVTLFRDRGGRAQFDPAGRSHRGGAAGTRSTHAKHRPPPRYPDVRPNGPRSGAHRAGHRLPARGQGFSSPLCEARERIREPRRRVGDVAHRIRQLGRAEQESVGGRRGAQDPTAECAPRASGDVRAAPAGLAGARRAGRGTRL